MAKRRCVMKAEWTGKRCQKRAVKGMRVCRWHSVEHDRGEKEAQKIYDASVKQAQEKARKFREEYFDFAMWVIDGARRQFLTQEQAINMLNERAAAS